MSPVSPPMRPVALSLLLACGVACRRESTGAGTDGGYLGDAALTTTAPFDPPVRAPSEPPPDRAWPQMGEPHAVLTTAPADDPALRPFWSKVKGHFSVDGGGPSALLAVQRASLLGGGAATLVQRPGELDSSPMLLVEDRARRLLWERTRPTVAMLMPVREPVVVGRHNGGVALFAFDVPAKVVAGRFLDADGTPFTDLVALRNDDCPFVSAAYARRGLFVACSRLDKSRLQLVRHDATVAFASEGLVVGQATRVVAPLALGIDSDDSIIVVQLALRDAERPNPHAFAFRYNSQGRALWAAPVDLGATAPPAPHVRLAVESFAGGIKVALPAAQRGEPERTVELSSGGEIRRP